VLLHHGGCWLAAQVLLLMSLDDWRPWRQGPLRADRAAALGVVLPGLLAVPAAKRFSLSSCPWDLAEFGGVGVYVWHWRWVVADGGPGGCIPFGHAVAAWAFIGMHAPWRAARTVSRRRCWPPASTSACSSVLRGAHVLSHRLWSA
jgi:membrane-associated PAP2 superfamily phosphatase